MIVLDANILLYAYDAESKRHSKARRWVDSVFSGDETVALPWQTIGAFLRIVTHPGLPGNRLDLETAVGIVDSWLDQPNTRLLSPGDSHWNQLRPTILEGQASGALLTDAQLAALVIESGGTLYTTDRDFARFPGLRWMNPLE